MRPDTETLTRLYIDERLTSYEIAAMCQVNRVSVIRWLKKAGIPIRPGGRGLANRGVTAPSAEELTRLVHVEHLSYREIADRYSVDFTAIPYWLKRHAIERPSVWETRRRGTPEPTFDVAKATLLYESGISTVVIGGIVGMSSHAVGARLKGAGVRLRDNGWDGGKRIPCADSHNVRSTYEQRVCNWLTEHSVEHVYEPRLPWDLRSRADFLANGWYVEVWGVTDSPTYATRRDRKIAGDQANGASLVQIHHYDFSRQKRGRWQRKLSVIVDSMPLERLL